MPSIILSIAFLLVSTSLTFNFGFFNGNITPIVLLILAFFLLLSGRLIPSDKKYFGWVIPLLFILTYLLYIYCHPAMWMGKETAFLVNEKLIWMGLVPLLLFIIPWKNKLVNLLLFSLLLTLALILRLNVLSYTPFPFLDVFIILKEAPLKLLEGLNPYHTLYTPVFPGIIPDYYAYWPASFLLQLPFMLVFKDPRVLLIAADTAAALLLFLIAGKNRRAMMVSLTYLFRPQSLFIIEGTWLTPLNFFFTAFIIYLIGKKAPKEKTGIALGILTSIQFFHAAYLPYILKFLKLSRKFLLTFLGVIAVIVLPFVLVDPAGFFNQTVLVYFRNPPHPSILIHTSLNINTLFFHLTGKDISSVWLILAVCIIALYYLIKQQKGPSALVGSITMVFFTVFLFGKQAFVNYYYFIGSMILLWIASMTAETNIRNEK